jgi:hypothetical protein
LQICAAGGSVHGARCKGQGSTVKVWFGWPPPTTTTTTTIQSTTASHNRGWSSCFCQSSEPAACLSASLPHRLSIATKPVQPACFETQPSHSPRVLLRCKTGSWAASLLRRYLIIASVSSGCILSLPLAKPKPRETLFPSAPSTQRGPRRWPGQAGR